MPLPDLFQWLKGSQKSGVLTVIAHDQDRALHFVNGHIESYTSRELRENLGQLLVTHGLISERDINEAFRRHRAEHAPLVQLLLGYIDEAEAKRVLSEAARDVVLDLFLEQSGEFIFTDDEDEIQLDDAPLERVPLDLDMEEAILEGMRRLDEWHLVRAKLKQDTMRLRVVDRAWLDGLKKPSRTRRIFEHVDRGLSLGEICLELRASRYSIYRTIHHAMEDDKVAVVDPGELQGPQTGPGADRVKRLVAQAQQMLEARQWDEAATLFDLISRINPDDAEARDGYRRALEEQAAELYQLFPPIAVPRLSVQRDALREFKLTNEELFLATRVNGESDVGTLVMMSPIGEHATLRTLRKLLHIGVISLDLP